MFKSPGRKRNTVIWAFAGPKGGVGKTFLTAGLSALLSSKGRHTLACDADVLTPNLHSAFGEESPQKSPCKTSVRKLSFVSFCFGREPLHKLLQREKPEYDFITLDFAPGLLEKNMEDFIRADQPVLITTPEPASIELVYRFLRELTAVKLRRIIGEEKFMEVSSILYDMEISPVSAIKSIREKIAAEDPDAGARIEQETFDKDIKLLVNQVKDHNDQALGPSICEVISKFYGFHTEYLGYISSDERVANSTRNNRLFVNEYPDTETTACFSLILDKLLRNSDSSAGVSKFRLMGFR